MSATTEQAATPQTPDPEQTADRGPITYEALAVIAHVVAFAACILAVFSMGLATRSIDEHRSTPATGSGTSEATSVTLDEFTISPGPLALPVGGSLSVKNGGTTIHDLAVEGQDLKTAQLNPGDEGELDLAELPAGSYTVYCQIPGHRESGMEGDLTVS